MKMLITNDDGVDAPGLRVLFEAAQRMGEVVVVAPDDQRSSCGHQVTTHRPLRIVERARQWFAVDGTPADCVRIGLLQLAREVDWVFAGVNDGGNLGVDVVMSGTVAAVREAALLRRPAIAFSQYRKSGRPRDWVCAESHLDQILSMLTARTLDPLSYWNVNFPDGEPHGVTREFVICEVDDHPLPIHFSSVDEQAFQYGSHYHARPRHSGKDVDVCFSGNVAISKLQVFGSF